MKPCHEAAELEVKLEMDGIGRWVHIFDSLLPNHLVQK